MTADGDGGPEGLFAQTKSGFALGGFWQAGLPIRDSGAPREEFFFFFFFVLRLLAGFS